MEKCTTTNIQTKLINNCTTHFLVCSNLTLQYGKPTIYYFLIKLLCVVLIYLYIYVIFNCYPCDTAYLPGVNMNVVRCTAINVDIVTILGCILSMRNKSSFNAVLPI